MAELGSVGVRLVIVVFYMNKYFIKDVFNINTVILNDVSGLHGLRSETALFLLSSLAPSLLQCPSTLDIQDRDPASALPHH